MGLLRFLRSLRETAPAAAEARAAAVHQRVAELTADEAEAEVRDCITMGDPFHATAGLSTDAWSGSKDVPAEVRALFGSYQQVAAGGMQLRRLDVRPYSRDQSFIRIGSDLEHADVVVRRSDGRVFVIEDDDKPELDLSDAHATVWHYLLEVAEHTRGQPSRE